MMDLGNGYDSWKTKGPDDRFDHMDDVTVEELTGETFGEEDNTHCDGCGLHYVNCDCSDDCEVIMGLIESAGVAYDSVVFQGDRYTCTQWAKEENGRASSVVAYHVANAGTFRKVILGA